MAQYYNLVTNTSGTLCTVDGQRVQLVVEDVNNGGNGSQQFVAYTTAPQNSEHAIFSPQTINLGNQIATTRLEQGPNVFIIKTNNITTTQEILKSNTINPHVVSENIASITDNTSTKTECNSEGQQIRWIKMQDSSTVTTTKQNTLLQEKKQTAIVTKGQIQNNVTSQPPLNINSESVNTKQVEKKLLPKFHQNKSRQLTTIAQTVTASQISDGVTVINTMENRVQNSTVANPKPATSVCGKAVNALGQNISVRPIRASNSNTAHVRPVAMVAPEISKTPSTRIQPSDLRHLNEQIKQAKLKQMHLQRQLHSEQQKLQQNNAQRQQHQLPNASQHSVQSTLNSPTRNLIATLNPTQQRTQQRTQQVAPSLQGQQVQKSSMVTPVSSSAAHNVRNTSTMDVDSLGCTQEVAHLSGQPSSPRSEHENSASESVAYLQKTISDPANTIVQHQIKGNTAKMLVMLPTGEQRLVTFDIPNEDCTVHDLLEQVNITFSGEIAVSLVDDPALGINYIVDAGSATFSTAYAISSDHSDCNSTQEIVTSTTETENSTQNTNVSDENSNSSTPSNEEPILVKGMLAICPHCGYSSLHFNRCERCSTKLGKEVKSIPIRRRKETGLPVDMFYKKNNERNVAKLEKMERDGPSSSCKRPRGKGRSTASKPKPINKEPECLTISSDEEEDKTKKTESTSGNTTLGNTSNALNEDMDAILDKEPIITNTSVSSSCDDLTMNSEESNNGFGLYNDQSFMDNGQLPHTAIECRTVRIGSYKYIPREKVVITQYGVRFGVPLLEDEKSFVTLDVKYRDIIKVLIHFGKTMPVLFFYTSTTMGAMIRELLGMQDPKGPYYDPAGKDHTHKRITLLPERLTEDSKAQLKSLFLIWPKDKMEELDPKEANEILLRASPKSTVQSFNNVRRSSVTSIPNTVACANDAIQTITVYPPPPAKGGIAINTEDYLCLAEDQFLNDVIIDFYLKYLTLEVLSESDQQRTHVLSSYFYKRLTSPHTQATESSVPMTPAAKRHARVQKWTKNVNIFEKDFIIIPINEHAHWFLAIICFPGLVGKVSTYIAKTKEDEVHKTVQKSKKLKEVKAKAVTIGCTTITPVPATITIDQLDDGSERDEAEGDDDEMEVDSEEEDETAEEPESNKCQPIINKSEQNISQQEETVKVPCILIFDSLAGASRARVVATLRDYLSCEHVAKLGVEKIFSKDTIKGACPKVPQQSNFTDCGLYVLQYVESFFKDPIKNYTLPIKTLKTWFEEIIVTRKREELSKLLINLKGDRAITLPNLNFPTQDGKLKPKSENHADMKVAKSELENKKKSTASDGEARISMSVVTESTEPTKEVVSRTYQIIPYSPCISSNLTEGNAEMATEPKTQRSSSETMSYLKSKRIPRLMSRTQNQEDSQPPKKLLKAESYNSCK